MKVIFHSNPKLEGQRDQREVQINQVITASQYKTQDRNALYKSIKHMLEQGPKSFLQKAKERFGSTQIIEQPFTGLRFTDVRFPSKVMVAYFESAHDAKMAANCLTHHLKIGTRHLPLTFPYAVWVMQESQEQTGNE